jgi:endonuclease/exonuclease/phosphatase family metal-dependent hydrolase
VKIFKRDISFGEIRARINEERKRKLNWFNRLMLWLNYVAIVALLCSYCARYINPATFWYIAFFGLAYPVILLLNGFFILYWFAQLRLHGSLSLFAILLGMRSLFSYVQITPADEKPLKTDIKVMSYNCMLFDLYNWSENKQSREKIFGMLEEEAPDIICFQEFYTSENGKNFNNVDTLKKFLPANSAHTEYTTTLRETDHWGIATFSRYPIVRKGKLIFNTRTNNICIFTDVIIDKDTVRVYNMHLQSIQFRKEDYKFVSDVVNNKETAEELEHGKNILRRLKRGFLKRSFQADLVRDHMNKCRYKMIVCGDFNDTPSSYSYHAIRGEMKDAFIEKGSGFEKTYNGKMPAFRIDYILHSSEIKTVSYKKVGESFTDHFPVTAYLRLK